MLPAELLSFMCARSLKIYVCTVLIVELLSFVLMCAGVSWVALTHVFDMKF
jgi:hypothetical protein